jgi:hypothetical protein
MPILPIDTKHKERDWKPENVCGECQRKAPSIAQKTILPLKFNIEQLIELIFEAGDSLPRELHEEFDSVLATAKMELDESWAAIFDIWDHPTGGCSHSSEYASLELYTPPRSPPDPPKQGTSNKVESEEGVQQPCTPIGKIFESLHYETYKGVQQTVRTPAPDPFTPEDSPLPLFARRTPPDLNALQGSKASQYQLENTTIKEYQTMEQSREDSLLGGYLSDPALIGEEDLSSNRDGKPVPPPRTVIECINRDLIRCCADLAMHRPACLGLADNALAMSEEAGIYHLVSRSQLYRGLCLMELKRWKEASCAFTRAASVRDWQGKVWELKNMAESNLLQESRRKGKARIERMEDESWDKSYR